jgi:hypothetical protein
LILKKDMSVYLYRNILFMACACKKSSTTKAVKQVTKTIRKKATATTAQKRIIRRPAR